MKLQELFLETEKPEAEQTQKAGLIPFIIEGGEPVMLFFISSDSTYGGDDPQIAKGGTKDGEDLQEAAIREAEEELGLKQSNIEKVISVGNFELAGLTHAYKIALYAAKMKDKNDFNKPGWEAKGTVWMTLDEFEKSGRKSQLSLVKDVYKKIT